MKLVRLVVAVPFVLLLLVAPLAGADTDSAAATPATAPTATEKVDLASIFTAPEEAVPAEPDCAEAELALFAPAPSEQATSCGPCSDTLCQGKQFGQFCKFQSGRAYSCRFAIAVCAANDCQYWTGALP